MKSSDVKHLADLAYITIPNEQQTAFEQDFQGILSNIATLSEVSEEIDTLPQYYHQTLREDDQHIINPAFSPDIHQKLLDSMPQIENGYLVVKTILTK